ncbi:hypothetical protein VTJ83DRAFT_7197 [Remersonia thermophila]|uniref:Transcriptional coactivator p15 (PC4) C-terminal domain-containing protein n=1 Tax=Remersonia thermophila TaxID=72144 RepID=A0ABR4D314_9PEZI
MPFPKKKRQAESEGEEEPQVTKKSKSKASQPAKGTLTQGKDAEGNPFWEIGNNRRIGFSEFKGTTLVNIREFYTAPNGELKPGKKGISLTLEQYKALLRVLPELNASLQAEGHDVGSLPSGPGGTEEAAAASSKSTKAKKPKRSNIDATSEEDEGDQEEEEGDE